MILQDNVDELPLFTQEIRSSIEHPTLEKTEHQTTWQVFGQKYSQINLQNERCLKLYQVC